MTIKWGARDWGAREALGRIDLTGQRFGRLVATRWEKITTKTGKPRYYWWCKCDCGKDHRVSYPNLTANRVKSCGCLHREKLAERNAERHAAAVKRQISKLTAELQALESPRV